MKKKFKFWILLGASLLAAYWYFFSGYFTKHLFYNRYESRIGEPWHWEMEPDAIMDPDGTTVLVDYARNELAVLQNAPGDEGLSTTGNDASGISVGIGRNWVAIPELPNTCVLIEESGVRVGRTLKPGEAKLLFAQLQKETPGNLRAAIPADLLRTKGATSSTTKAPPPP